MTVRAVAEKPPVEDRHGPRCGFESPPVPRVEGKPLPFVCPFVKGHWGTEDGHHWAFVKVGDGPIQWYEWFEHDTRDSQIEEDLA